ncbi:hypothetical protein T484DRAFT_1756478 [Baffinella frigidus]|nr:hypothetical protein T484DRAFT_1756478 [Cryptophyta sp. CCMP2293]
MKGQLSPVPQDNPTDKHILLKTKRQPPHAPQAPSPVPTKSPSASKPAHDESCASALPMTAPSQNPMLIADFTRKHRVGPHHPAALHDELLARRHAQRAPRACSLEAKLTSSFLPADRAPNDASSSDSSSVPTSAPPSTSHDDFLARRHAQRAPRACALETKLTSSLDDCECVVHTPNDDTCSDSSSSAPSTPSTSSPASHLRSKNQGWESEWGSA